MTTLPAPAPFPYFTDASGTALDNGKIYIGTAGLDPRTNAIPVYQDAANTIAWAQPLRTVSGYPAYQGAASNFYPSAGDYSIIVTDSQGAIITRDLNAVSLASGTGAGMIGADDSASGTLWTTVQGFINKLLSSAGASVLGSTRGSVQTDLDAIKIGSDLASASLTSYNSTLSKMGKLAAAAERGNLFINPVSASAATIASPATAPSTTGYTNQLPVGQGFVAQGWAATTANSNVVVVSPPTGLIVGQCMMEHPSSGAPLPTYIEPGSVITAISGNNVTLSRPAKASTSGVMFRCASRMLDYIGGVPFDNGGNLSVSGATIGNAVDPPTLAQMGSAPYAIEFWTDAATFTTGAAGLLLSFYQAGATPNKYRVAIDDVYQTAAPQAFGGTGSTFLTIQFAAAGPHKVRIELPAGYFLQQLWTYGASQIWKPTNGNEIRLCMFGDSFFQNGEAGSWGMRNMAAICATMLGCKFDLCSQGGTGYASDGGTNYNWQSDYRIDDTKRRSYDAIVCFGTLNDYGFSTAQVTAAALNTWQKLRAANPSIPILVFGIPITGGSGGANPTNVANYENALLTAFNTWADSESAFFPMTVGADGYWTTVANQSTYISTVDNAHPRDDGASNFAGPLYLGGRMANTVKTFLRDCGAY